MARSIDEKFETKVIRRKLVKQSNIPETARYDSGIRIIMAKKGRTNIRYIINGTIDADEDELPVFRFLKVSGFLFSSTVLVLSMAANCSKFTPKRSQKPRNRSRNAKINLSIDY